MHCPGGGGRNVLSETKEGSAYLCAQSVTRQPVTLLFLVNAFRHRRLGGAAGIQGGGVMKPKTRVCPYGGFRAVWGRLPAGYGLTHKLH